MSRRVGQVLNRGGGKYLIRWSAGTGAAGKRLRQSNTIHGTKKDAERELRRILRARDVGQHVEPSRETLGGYLERWLGSTSTRLAQRTVADYRGLVENYVKPVLGGMRLDQIRRSHIRGFIETLSSKPLRSGLGTLSPRTVRLAHAVLSSALRDAVRDELIAKNPAEFASLPRQERKEMCALSAVDVSALRATLEGDRHAVLFDFLLGTGCRPGEAFALRWSDIDLEEGIAIVRRSLSRDSEGRPMFKDPKTKASRRAIPLPNSLVVSLREHRGDQAVRALKLGPSYDRGSDLVFANEAGATLNSRNVVNRHFKPALKRAGLPSKVRLYDLRHTHATALLSAGVNAKVAAERLGHATTRQTLDTYSHVMPGMQEEATRRIEETLFA